MEWTSWICFIFTSSVISGLIIAKYKTTFHGWYQKMKFIYNLIKMIQNISPTNSSHQHLSSHTHHLSNPSSSLSSSSLSSLMINDSGKAASLLYEKGGKQYVLNVPYQKNLLHKMANCHVILFKEDKKEEVNITQQPGIPYWISPDQLGGIKAEIRYEDGTIKEISRYELIQV